MRQVAKIAKVIGFVLIFLSINNIVFAVDCSEKVRASTAKAIARRDDAYVRHQIALAYEQIETSYQAQLTAKMEEKYAAAISSTTYVSSIRPIIRAELEKQLIRARKTRTRESTNALKDRREDVESAQKKFNKAFGKVPTNLGCTL